VIFDEGFERSTHKRLAIRHRNRSPRPASSALTYEIIASTDIEKLTLLKGVEELHTISNGTRTSCPITGERYRNGSASPAWQALEQVLKVRPGQSRSLLFRFREYPPEATPACLIDYLDRYRELSSLGVAGFDLSGTRSAVIEHLAQL